MLTPTLVYRSRQPEGVDSFAAVSLLSVAKGDIYPIYRLLTA